MLRRSNYKLMKKIILGLVGEMATGKGTAARYIVEKYNGKAFKFSTLLRDVLDRLYLEQSRENLQKISTVLRQNFGEDLFASVMAGDVKKDSADIIVIDGIRRPADIKYLKEIPEFKFVYIETDVKKCYGRLIGRQENSDDVGKTFEEFKKEHEAEPEQQIRDLKKNADYVVDNNGSLKALHQQLDKIIDENSR